MSDMQKELNDCVEAFVADIAEMARQAAYDALSNALAQTAAAAAPPVEPASRPAAPRSRGRASKRRSPDEIDTMAEFFYVYVTQKPGQRMEQIAQALGYSTAELNLPVKKLLNAGKIRMEGNKRATQYYPAGGRGRR